jgi:hypothetical protein
LYHGKKTVPATVRQDLWTPYFSIHFPSTQGGVLEGLFAFHKLRELSMQRQLSPPDYMIRATEEDIARVKYHIGSPVTLQEMAVEDRNELKQKIPKLGEILPKKLRARKLMDQKATSVADAAFVLDWILSGPSPWERVKKVATNRVIHTTEMSARAAKRINRIREAEEAKEPIIRQRARMAVKGLNADERAPVHLTLKALHRLSLEKQRQVHQKSSARTLSLQHLEEYIAKDTLETLNTKTPERKQLVKAIETREEIAKQAEKGALQEWFEKNDSHVVGSESVWTQVAIAREAALKAYDEQEESKSALSSGTQTGVHQASQATCDSSKTTRKGSAEADSIEDEVKSLKPDWTEEPREVKMYWSDMSDGLFAASWPKNVIHGTLAPFSVSKVQPRNRSLETKSDLASKSVHVVGAPLESGWVSEWRLDPENQRTVWEQPSAKQEEQEMATQDGAVKPEYKALDSKTTTGRIQQLETGDPDIVVEQKRPGIWQRLMGVFGRR